MTGLELITNAFYLSGIVGREFETPTDAQVTDGLRIVNFILSEKTKTGELIPYYGDIDFPFVIAQEKYFLQDLITLDAFTFNIETVRYNMQAGARHEYFGDFRVDNVKSLPSEYYLERTKGGMNVYVYPIPSGTFLGKIKGRFSLQSIALFDDINVQLEEFYISYLQYKLAERLCRFYTLPFPAESRLELKEMEATLTKLSPADLSIRKVSTFPPQTLGYWGYVNLYTGWVPY